MLTTGREVEMLLHAGVASARDPATTIEPQRARLRDGMPPDAAFRRPLYGQRQAPQRKRQAPQREQKAVSG